MSKNHDKDKNHDHKAGKAEGPLRRFHRRRAEAAALPSKVALTTDALLAIGYLIGAEMPGCAASISILLERAFPDEGWPWTEAKAAPAGPANQAAAQAAQAAQAAPTPEEPTA